MFRQLRARIFRYFSQLADNDLVAQMRQTADIHPKAALYPTALLVLNGHSASCIRIGMYSHVRGQLVLFGHGGQINIGEYCYVGEQTRIWSGINVSIGNRVLIGHQVTIMDNLTHPMDAEKRHEQFRQIVTTGHPRDIDLKDSPVVIEDDVWIGCQCVILAGVTIGKGAVIAAGSIVTRDIPAGTVVAGNPARVIKSVNA